jgi:hypothetical protein
MALIDHPRNEKVVKPLDLDWFAVDNVLYARTDNPSHGLYLGSVLNASWAEHIVWMHNIVVEQTRNTKW